MKLVTVTQMRAIEKEADANGVSYAQLMQNAGRGLAELVHGVGQENGWDRITALVGPGNNGGDALVALTWLAQAGWTTHAHLVKREAGDDDLVMTYLSVGGEVTDSGICNRWWNFLNEFDVLLDGLLGTGIKLPLKKEAALVLAKVQKNFMAEMELPPFVVAVDCPSGIDCDFVGEAADETIPADLTITMAAVKQGLLKLPAFEFVGELQVVEIGLPDDLRSWNEVKVDVADDGFCRSVAA